jgi:Raf kinase inhibitor-like YbhB/YbcL family protein
MAFSKWTRRITLLLVVLALILVGALLVIRRHSRADIAQGQIHPSITVETSSFLNGDNIPERFTCDGAGLSPEIHWLSPPSGARSLAIVMDDPDAPLGFVHWLVYDIPVDARDIAEGASSQAGLPHGAVEGINSSDTVGYTGPCPPGAKPHHYVFRLYALDVPLDLPPGRTKEQLAAAVKDHVLAEGQITGLYGRGSLK